METPRPRAGSALDELSMQAASYGYTELAERLFEDWFEFLGGRPREVVLVENGSPFEGQKRYAEGVRRGWLTKYLSVRPGAPDVGKHQAYIGELSALGMCTRPLNLMFRLDTLVYRKGHDGWLDAARERLREPGVFAVGGSFNAPCKARDLDADWFRSKKLSGNFALLPRAYLLDAWRAIVEDFLRSGFRIRHPLRGNDVRFIQEIGIERALASRDWYTHVRRESADWTVFHTNLADAELARAREKFRRREGIAPFMNRGDVLMTPENARDLLYFDRGARPTPGAGKRLREAVGATRLGAVWRAFKEAMELEKPAEAPLLLGERVAHDSGPARYSVVVVVDDDTRLGADLAALEAALGGRPGQIVLLAPAGGALAESAWDLHVAGASEKLLLSRDLDPARGLDARMLVEHGIFALAHHPELALCTASALGELTPMLAEHAATGRVLPIPPQLAGCTATVQRRSRLMEALEPELGECVALGSGDPGEDWPRAPRVA